MAGWQERHRLVPRQATSRTLMPKSRVLFWHRRDLRLADNLGLVAAAQISPAVTGVYVLDPAVINPPPASSAPPQDLRRHRQPVGCPGG